MKSVRMLLAAVMTTAVLFPAMAQQDAGKFSIGLFGSATKLVGDSVDRNVVSPWFGAKLGVTITPLLSIIVSGGYGWTRPMDWNKDGITKQIAVYPGTTFKTTLIPVLGALKLNLHPSSAWNPYVTVGGGLLIWDLTSDGVTVHEQQKTNMIDGGLGFEWFLTYNFGIELSAHYQYLFDQKLDMSGYNDVQEGNIEAQLGINFYLGGKRDADNDGILDKIDKCPDVPEDSDGFRDADGCPDYDNDNDGIPDSLDRCPRTAGPAANKGCPDVDSDMDGIVNRLDKCRKVAEDNDGFEDDDGCPDYDNDKDGVPDTLDKCINVVGLVENNGCPDVDSDNDGIVDRLDKCPNNPGVAETQGCPQTKAITREGLILRGVTFQVGKAVLTQTSWLILDPVVTSLREWPEVRIEIQGHTDITGNRAKNQLLSQQRAEAVLQYFVDRGISASRLSAVGYGPDMPVADNKTAAGRANNRRVELKRID